MNSLVLFLLTWLGFNPNPSPKFDLHKKTTREDYNQKINLWIGMNDTFICILVVIFLLVVFIWLVRMSVGISAVESGALRNFIIRGV